MLLNVYLYIYRHISHRSGKKRNHNMLICCLCLAPSAYWWFVSYSLLNMEIPNLSRNIILCKIFHYSDCRKLTKELCEVIEDYSLVNFTTLDIQVLEFLAIPS